MAAKDYIDESLAADRSSRATRSFQSAEYIAPIGVLDRSGRRPFVCAGWCTSSSRQRATSMRPMIEGHATAVEDHTTNGRMPHDGGRRPCDERSYAIRRRSKTMPRRSHAIRRRSKTIRRTVACDV